MSYSYRGPRPQRASASTRSYGAPRKFNSRSRFANPGVHIDASRFVNKTVAAEEVAPFVPRHSFADFKFQELLKRNIDTRGYPALTPIQDEAIPHVIEGKDLVGIANTGTG